MIKRLILLSILATSCVFAMSLQSVETAPATAAELQKRAEEKYAIMKRDQVEPTDALAIPLDDSEIEDEAEIDRVERSDTFPLPHSPK